MESESDLVARRQALLAEVRSLTRSPGLGNHDDVERIVGLEDEARAISVELAQRRAEPWCEELHLSLPDRPQSWVTPSPSGSDSLPLYHWSRPFVLLVGAVFAPADPLLESAGTVALVFETRSVVARVTLGHPNEDAFWADGVLPVGFTGIGVWECHGSGWPRAVVAANRLQFPDFPDPGLRHLIVACKEDTTQVLALDVTAEAAGDWGEYVRRYHGLADEPLGGTSAVDPSA